MKWTLIFMFSKQLHGYKLQIQQTEKFCSQIIALIRQYPNMTILNFQAIKNKVHRAPQKVSPYLGNGFQIHVQFHHPQLFNVVLSVILAILPQGRHL